MDLAAGQSLTAEQKENLRLLFPARPERACEDCGGYHLRACPRVKSQEWVGEGAGTGNRTRVEYWNYRDVDWSEVIWPEEVFDE